MIWILSLYVINIAVWYCAYRRTVRRIETALSEFKVAMRQDGSQDPIEGAKRQIAKLVGSKNKLAHAMFGALFLFSAFAAFQFFVSLSHGGARVFDEPRLLTITIPILLGFAMGWNAVALAVSNARSQGRLWML